MSNRIYIVHTRICKLPSHLVNFSFLHFMSNSFVIWYLFTCWPNSRIHFFAAFPKTSWKVNFLFSTIFQILKYYVISYKLNLSCEIKRRIFVWIIEGNIYFDHTFYLFYFSNIILLRFFIVFYNVDIKNDKSYM